MRRKNKRNSILRLMTAREIRKTFGRFFAIFAIIALGSGFFAGLRSTTPLMIRTVDRFWRDSQLYDYRILASYGWKEKEVEAFRKRAEVRAAEGAWQYDVLIENEDGSSAVYKVHSMTEELNGIRLTEGRLPQNATECLMDESNHRGYELGDEVTFSKENDEDTLEAFEADHFTVVGFIDASLYLNFERGTTSIGNGSVAGFIYLPKNAFSNDYYTEIYVKLDTDPEIYSDAYTDLLDAQKTEWEEAADEQAEERYDEIRTDAQGELDDAKKEFEDKKADGEQELRDAETELDDAKKELDDGEKELKDAKKELDDGEKELEDAKKELADGEQELKDAEKELADGKKELDDAEAKLADAKAELDSAADEIRDGEAQLQSGKAELAKAKKELDANKKKLDKAKKELEKAENELTSGKAELDASEKTLVETGSELAAAKATLDEKEGELAAAKEMLDASNAELQAAKDTLDENAALLEAGAAAIRQKEEELAGAEAAGVISEEEAEAARQQIEQAKAEQAAGQAAYDAGLSEYKSGKAEYDAGLAQYESGKAAYDEGLRQYKEGNAAYQAGLAQFEKGQKDYADGLVQYDQGRAEYEEGLNAWKAGKAQYEEGLTTLKESEAKLEAGRAAYEEGKAQYEDGLREYEVGKKEYEDGLKEYEDGLKEYEDGKKEYEDGLREYEDGKKEYEDGLKEYEDGKKEYEDGVKEYEDGKETFDREIADAEDKISDAQKELDDLEEPDTWLLTRNTNVAYACFESDSQIVGQVAAVFPVFFILVAALVSMTTMSRMVEEQRGQMGVLKGLGYSENEIMSGFLTYSGTAAVLGCVAGYAVGVLLFPAVIWYAYQLMYISIPLRYYFDPLLFGGVLAAALACSLGSTYLSCRSALAENAASLMRPRAPKAGKRVFLENVPFIWKRMNFMHKVTARNIFRYKRRLFMMILGIGGCMALLLTGFGLKDSIRGFAGAQFDEIQKANAELIFRNGDGDEVPRDLVEAIREIGASFVPLIRGSWDAEIGSRVKSVDVVAFVGKENEDISEFFTLRDRKGNPLPLPADGEALISMSIAERYGLHDGDPFVLRNEDMKEMRVTVSGVFENYVYNYVIVSPETVRGSGAEGDVNGLYVNFPEGMDVYEGQAVLASADDTSSVTILKDFRDRLADMMEALNYVVLLVITSAGGLAFVVLYNLTNINIIERMREIATIKVLGFYSRETSDYIFRENMVLTVMGAGAGVFLGIALHRFVMSKIVVDLVCFPRKIRPESFAMSILLTFVFTLLVNLVMRGKLEKINMAESLKAVE